MATTQHIGLMTVKDPAGNTQLLYPVTTIPAVDGLEEALTKPHTHDYAEKSRVVGATLLTAGWEGTASPYTQLIDVPGMAADANANAGLASTATPEQIQAAAGAVIMATEQMPEQIRFTAYGTMPSIDIPIQIMIVG